MMQGFSLPPVPQPPQPSTGTVKRGGSSSMSSGSFCPCTASRHLHKAVGEAAGPEQAHLPCQGPRPASSRGSPRCEDGAKRAPGK